MVEQRQTRGRLYSSGFKAQGDVLFGKLKAMLKMPPPTLWRAMDDMQFNTNIWGHKIPTPQSVILNTALLPYVNRYLGRVLGLYGLGSEAIERFIRYARAQAKVAEDVAGYEGELKRSLTGVTLADTKDEALTQRARIICEEIAPFLQGDSLLDIGCGNGLIANLLKDRFTKILLTDVVKYVPAAFNLPFRRYTEGQPLPTADDSFDTVLLLTVLHHSTNPRELLKLAWGAAQKRLIIIESVIGVHQITSPLKYELVDMPDEDQIAFAAFVDWFYNRVLHDNVPVPYNFTTPERWQSIFVQNNMRLAQTIHLGQDIDIGPEYHILFVLEK